jgi:hypothetical protein
LQQGQGGAVVGFSAFIGAGRVIASPLPVQSGAAHACHLCRGIRSRVQPSPCVRGGDAGAARRQRDAVLRLRFRGCGRGTLLCFRSPPEGVGRSGSGLSADAIRRRRGQSRACCVSCPSWGRCWRSCSLASTLHRCSRTRELARGGCCGSLWRPARGGPGAVGTGGCPGHQHDRGERTSVLSRRLPCGGDVSVSRCGGYGGFTPVL